MTKIKETSAIDHARGQLRASRIAAGGSVETKKKFLRDKVSKMSKTQLHHTMKYLAPGTEVSPMMTKEELQGAITFALQGISVTPPQSARDRAVSRWVETFNNDWRRADDFILDIIKIAEDAAIRRQEMLKVIQGLTAIAPESKKRADSMTKPQMLSFVVGAWKKLYYHDTILRLNNSEKNVGHLRLLFGQGGIH